MNVVVALVPAAVVFLTLAVASYLAYGVNLRTMEAHETGPARPFYRAVRWSYFWEGCLIVGAAGSVVALVVAFILAVTS